MVVSSEPLIIFEPKKVKEPTYKLLSFIWAIHSNDFNFKIERKGINIFDKSKIDSVDLVDLVDSVHGFIYNIDHHN